MKKMKVNVSLTINKRKKIKIVQNTSLIQPLLDARCQEPFPYFYYSGECPCGTGLKTPNHILQSCPTFGAL